MVVLRDFDASLRDAAGILRVDRETIRNCRYGPEEIIGLLTKPGQRAWVAEEEGAIVGFVATFTTHTTRGSNLEIDLLEVLPNHQRQGIASALLHATVEQLERLNVNRARAWVATDNIASQKAFHRVGFNNDGVTYDLLLYEIRGYSPRDLTNKEQPHRLGSPDEARALRSLDPGIELQSDELLSLSQSTQCDIWVVGRNLEITAYCENLWVETFFYRGLWMETVLSRNDNLGALSALITHTIETAKRSRLDEIGCMLPQGRWKAKQAFVAAGFRPVNEYLKFLYVNSIRMDRR